MTTTMTKRLSEEQLVSKLFDTNEYALVHLCGVNDIYGSIELPTENGGHCDVCVQGTFTLYDGVIKAEFNDVIVDFYNCEENDENNPVFGLDLAKFSKLVNVYLRWYEEFEDSNNHELYNDIMAYNEVQRKQLAKAAQLTRMKSGKY